MYFPDDVETPSNDTHFGIVLLYVIFMKGKSYYEEANIMVVTIYLNYLINAQIVSLFFFLCALVSFSPHKANPIEW